MPRFDGTGPAGRGPMTGGGRGWCNPYGARYTGYAPRVFRGYRPFYRFARPRWGLRGGFFGRGIFGRGVFGRGFVGRGFRGRGRW